MDESSERKGQKSLAVYVEDALILVSVALLFVLAVFYRGRTWGQVALLVVLAVMVIIFVRRLRRTHRAFKGRE